MNRIVEGVGSNYLLEHMVIKIDVSIGIVIKLFMHFREKHLEPTIQIYVTKKITCVGRVRYIITFIVRYGNTGCGVSSPGMHN